MTAQDVTALTWALQRISDSITPNLVPTHDAAGGAVGSLTEAAMGITAGLVRIADSITDLAEAVREHTAR